MLIKSQAIRFINSRCVAYISSHKINNNIGKESLADKGRPKKLINENKNQQGKIKNKEMQAPINWKKYGVQISHIFQSKKNILDIDLAFIANKVALKEIQLTEQLVNVLKVHLKNLKEVSFSLLPQLLDFSFSIGIVNPPQLFLKTYLDYYQINTFSIQQNEQLGFPSYFLKKVAYPMLQICAERNYDELSVALRHFGGIISLNQMKKIDQLCSERIGKMKTEQVVKLLNIFRQIRKKGTFCELAQALLVQKQQQLSSKSIIMTVISFLQLGSTDSFTCLQGYIVQQIKNNFFNREEVISLMHILHKYKVGNLIVWQVLTKYFTQPNTKQSKGIPFQHLFVIMSGLSRNYRINSQLLVDLMFHEPTLSYAAHLKEKQFVEFYFVIYSHFTSLPLSTKTKYEDIIKDSILVNEQKSVYTEIKYFFLFLFDSNPSKRKDFLRKAYPNDTLLSLISHIYTIENIDEREKQQYKQQILSCYKQQVWQTHKDMVVAQQFIRYKLMATLKGQIDY